MTAKAKQPSEQKAGELKKDGKDPTACAWGIREQERSQQAQKNEPEPTDEGKDENERFCSVCGVHVPGRGFLRI